MKSLKAREQIFLIFGFAGAGKSTAADLLGERLGLRVVHPSSIVRNLLEKQAVNLKKTEAGTGFWESKQGFSLLQSRLSQKKPIDLIADKLLLKEIAKGNLVMDSWTMPWLSKKGIKIYIKAPLAVRAARVAKRGQIPLKEALRVTRLKDQDTRQLNKRLYGFDMQKDTQVFDLIIDNKNLSVAQVQQKIATFLKKREKKEPSRES